MNAIAQIALIGWLPVVVLLFQLLPARRAVFVSFVFGWMFLPEMAFSFSGLPDYDKITATVVPVFLCSLIFDDKRIRAIRPSWVDVPIVIWCLTPLATSLSNGLGAYDGMAQVLAKTLSWGLPYLIGRAYLTDRDAMVELAKIAFIGGLVYMPLCWYEMRMSPQLHRMVYGSHPAAFVHSLRYGGYRPMVFMHGGLAVGMWMATAALIGVIFWHSGVMRRLRGVPIGLLVLPLCVTLVLCKSMGATLLMAAAVVLYFATQVFKTRVFLLAAIVAVPVYLSLRIAVDWHGEEVITLTEAVINEDRAGSLETRMENERMILDEKWGRALLGWGGWGRNRVTDSSGNDISTVDSLWIITFSKFGLVGLVSVYLIMLLPVYLAVRRLAPGAVATPAMAPLVAMALIMWMAGMDKLLNAQPNVVFMCVAGGLMNASRLARVGSRRRMVRVVEQPPVSGPAGIERG